MRISLSCCLAALGDATWRVTVYRAITFVSTIMVSTSWTGALERRAVSRRGGQGEKGVETHCPLTALTAKLTAKPILSSEQRRTRMDKKPPFEHTSWKKSTLSQPKSHLSNSLEIAESTLENAESFHC